MAAHPAAPVVVRFELADDRFEVEPLRARLLHDAAGAYASFEGWVRDHNDGRPVLGLRYEAYAARFAETMKGRKGRLLAAQENPEVVEGTWQGTKLVLIEFPDEAGFRDWSESADYRAISADREAATEGCVLLVKGLG